MSIVFLLTKGTDYQLSKDRDHNEEEGVENTNKNFITLMGTGKLVYIPDLSDPKSLGLKRKKSFDKKISSSKKL